MGIESGRVLNDRYRLIRPVGQGSQASVWVADHLALTTQVAVKLIDPELAKKDDARERFRREATAAAQLRSAHVVQILDHGIDEDQPFIVMELLDGEDLFERLQKRVRLTLQETSKVVTQVARALTRAHAAGIVHRDLKPENVFLIPNDDEEIVKVLDFGVAKVNDPAKRTMQRTGVGTLLGTPHYMSPEQVKGITEVDYRSDIWSLGVIAYQCVTGELPFDSEGVGDLLIRITIGDAPVPSRAVPSLPPSFDAWFGKSCDRDPNRRFGSARDQAEALARAIGVVPEEGESTRYRFGNVQRAPPGVPRPASSPRTSDPALPRPSSPDAAAAAAPGSSPGARLPTPALPLVALKDAPRPAPEPPETDDVTDIDQVAPVAEVEAHRAPLESTDIDVEESLTGQSSRPPRPSNRVRAGSTPLPKAPARSEHTSGKPIGSALAEVGARSVPRSTVSGLSSPGTSSVFPPPELDGSRRRRVVGLFGLGFLALAAVVSWRVAQPYLHAPSAAAGPETQAPPEATAPPPRVDSTGPAVTSIDPGQAVDPGKKADAGQAVPPAPPGSASAGKKPRDKGSKRDPAVIEYDTPPPEEHGSEPEAPAPSPAP